MRLQYGGLQARLLGWKNHAWKDFSPTKINQIGAFVQLLRAATPDFFYNSPLPHWAKASFVVELLKCVVE